jgi:hypothetical protein
LLHPAARACIEAVERAHAAAPTATPDAELARAVARLSDLYTTDRDALAREQADAAHLAAKREYFLASDAPKVSLALAECARWVATACSGSAAPSARAVQRPASLPPPARWCARCAWRHFNCERSRTPPTFEKGAERRARGRA